MSNARILIVDHELSIADLVSGLLQQDGYETRIEQSSSGAIKGAAVFRPHLLVIEPVMPGLSGVETAIRISDEIKCKVLFLTTMAADQDFREMVRGLRQQGCHCDALPKPFSKEELLDYVRHRVGTAHGGTAASSQASPEGGVAEEAAPDSHQTSSPGYASPEGDYDALLKISTVQLYQVNAFRITGLNVDSSLRDITREGEKLEMSIKLGVVRSSNNILPLPEQASIPAIRAALQTLKDPEQRLLHEMFWFWPCIGQSKEDPALRALQLGNYQGAVNLWTNAMPRDKGIAVHNLAVFYHVRALDEAKQIPKTPTTAEFGEQSLWRNAYRYWEELIGHSEFWDSLTNRIREISDPRLAIETAQHIWSSLPDALLAINAHLAVSAAENENFEEAGKQLRLMYASEFGIDRAKKATLRPLAPLRDEVIRLCENAEREARSNPKEATAVLRKLFADKAKLLQAFNYLAGAGDPMRDAVHDRVAEAGRVCLVAYVNETEDWDAAQPLFEECLALSEGPALRSRLEEDLEIIAGNIAARNQRQSAATAKVSSRKSVSTNAAAFRAGRAVAAVSGWSKGKILLLSFLVLVIGGAAITGYLDDNPSTNTSSEPSGATPASSPVLPETPAIIPSTPQPPAARGVPDSPNYEISGDDTEAQELKTEIETARATLDTLENEIDRANSTLKSEETQNNSDRQTLDRMQRNQSLGVEVDVDAYERIRRRYNDGVDGFNAEVGVYNAKLAEYKQLLAATNAQISRYNSLRRSR
jgi:DNA-binding response OmpR family regulator